MPVYETGHARNVQHFQQLISFVDSWGLTYTPTNPSILLPALTAKLTAAETSIDNVAATLMDSKNTINQRENTFEPLRRLVTRVTNFYESTGAEKNAIEDVRSLKKKIDGVRAKPLVDDPNTPEDETKNNISASQQSYTQLVEHFDALILLLGSDPLYDPTEADLKLIALTAYSSDLKDANTAVIDKYTPVSTSRGARNTIMYAAETGLVDLALYVKKYAKAAYGTDSVQYKQISGLSFTRPNKRSI